MKPNGNTVRWGYELVGRDPQQTLAPIAKPGAAVRMLSALVSN